MDRGLTQLLGHVTGKNVRVVQKIGRLKFGKSKKHVTHYQSVVVKVLSISQPIQ